LDNELWIIIFLVFAYFITIWNIAHFRHSHYVGNTIGTYNYNNITNYLTCLYILFKCIPPKYENEPYWWKKYKIIKYILKN